MAPFKKKKKKQNVNVNENNKQETESQEKQVMTKLQFHPTWKVSNREKYFYQYYHQKLPKLLPNQVSIAKVRHKTYKDLIYVTAFLRNTLKTPIKFEEIVLLLLNEKDEPFARKQFSNIELTEIPAMASMPWEFIFSEEDLLMDYDLDNDDWKIAFELKRKNDPSEHSLELESSWEKQLSDEQRKKLEEIVKNLTPPSPGEVNIMGLEAKFIENDSFAVTVFIRNGSDKNIKLEQLPLVVEDGDGDLVCQGGFTLSDFEVRSNTTKPWTFIFPAELVKKTNPNLQKWRAFIPSEKATAK